MHPHWWYFSEAALALVGSIVFAIVVLAKTDSGSCLLYTSDAADERSSVDLGGRRIIKKKKDCTLSRSTRTH